MIKIISSPKFVILLPIIAILAAPGTGSSIARVAASAFLLLGCKVFGIDVDPEVWVSTLSW